MYSEQQSINRDSVVLERRIKEILGNTNFGSLMFALQIGCAGFYSEDDEFSLILNSGGITDFVTIDSAGRITYMHYDQLQIQFDTESQAVIIEQAFNTDDAQRYNYNL